MAKRRRSTGKYCVVKRGAGNSRGKKVSCHKYLRVAKRKALNIGGIVVDNMECSGARCGFVYYDPTR
jgi:hypothetical protein